MFKKTFSVLITFLALLTMALSLPVILVALIPVALMYLLSRSTTAGGV